MMRHNLAIQPHPQARRLIYIVCRSAWAAGILHGAWIDMIQCLEGIEWEVEQFLAKSPVPGDGFLIKDYRGFYSLKIGSKEDLGSVREKACLIEDYGLLGVKLFQHYGEDMKATQRALRYGYQGGYEDELEYAMEFFGSQHLNQVPRDIRDYIDYPKFKRDLFANNHFSIQVAEHCHVFVRV